ncbi:MAG: HD domain-containing phosphohydrolase [Gemmatimonadota bacterium]
MALRMSQMLRSSNELRRIKPGGAGRPAKAPVPETAAAVTASELDPLMESQPAEDAAEEPSEPAEAASLAVYRQLVAAAEAVFAAAAAGTAPNGHAVVTAVRAAAADLRAGDGLLAETVRQRHDARAWPNRCANVAILGMRLGIALEYDERKTLALGLCGVMHDVGMLTLPRDMLENRRLSGEQWELLKQHPAESERMIRGFGPAFEWIAKIVVQVHERHDGSGYPKGLRGEHIHEFARIIGLVDAYEAMAQPRADREARVVYNALKEIIDLRNTLFDRQLIRALIYIVSIFPLGSLVKLNNGEIGRVVGTSRSHPTRPAIDVLVDARGRRLKSPRIISLQAEPMLYIVDPAIEEGVLGVGR